MGVMASPVVPTTRTRTGAGGRQRERRREAGGPVRAGVLVAQADPHVGSGSVDPRIDSRELGRIGRPGQVEARRGHERLGRVGERAVSGPADVRVVEVEEAPALPRLSVRERPVQVVPARGVSQARRRGVEQDALVGRRALPVDDEWRGIQRRRQCVVGRHRIAAVEERAAGIGCAGLQRRHQPSVEPDGLGGLRPPPTLRWGWGSRPARQLAPCPGTSWPTWRRARSRS